MKKAFSRKVLLTLLAVLCFSSLLAAASCKKKPDPTTYTVTYEGTDLAAATYEENATINKPEADPAKAGQVFVGWYTDASYDVIYTFGNAITADVKIYARFITPIDPEFKVTYVNDGTEMSSSETIGNIAFNSPVPTKAGHTFAGWWVSDYEDATKLTYKYDEQKLGSDTTLYAVWDEANVSVSSTAITWAEKSATSNYSISITKDGKEVESHRVTGGSSYAFDFSKLDAGDYVVSVSVNNTTSTAYYKNKGLDRVSRFEVIGGSLLMYNSVSNATTYYITVDCGNEAHKHVLLNNGNKITYDFSDCTMKKGGIAFTVTASANGYMNSVSETYRYEANLTELKNVKVNASDATVSWDAVANAEYYLVEVGNKSVTVTDASCSLKYLEPGEYTVKVTAVAHGYNSASASTSYNKTSIPAPTEVKINGTSVTWAEVEGATAYKVKVNGAEYDAATNQYALADFDSTATVSVKAIKSGADSAYSDEITVAKTLGEIKYSENTVSWNPVYGESQYRVSVNGGTPLRVDGNSCVVELTKKGDNEIVVATGNASNKITVTAYEVNFNTDGGSPVGTKYYAQGDKLVSDATSTKYGYNFASWYTTNNANNGKAVDPAVYTVGRDVTLYAKWQPKTIKLTLDYATEGVESTTVDVLFNERFTLPVPPANEDELKTFTGWYSDGNAEGTRYTDEKGLSINAWAIDREEMRVVAGWLNVLSYNLINNGAAYSVSAGPHIDNVTTVTIPTTYNGLPVTTVEGSAFRGCEKLLEVNIPDTIVNVETGTAFISCYALKAINIYKTDVVAEKRYYSDNGVLFYDNPNNEGVELKAFPAGIKGEYSIPEGVEVIPINVFRSASISVIHIPSTVVKIDTSAFSSQTITEIIFENTPAGQTEQPLDISADAFGYCSSLKSITLPKRLRSFDPTSLSTCWNLSEVRMEGAGAYFSADSGVLLTFDKSEVVFCPHAKTSYAIPSSVSKIGANAFESTPITSIVIPANVTYISENAFYNCIYLTKVDFRGTSVNDGALTIESYAFYGCSRLAEVTLPANLTVLKEYAFGDCDLLQKVTVNCGSSVEFENNAFSDDEDNGSNITALTIGKDFYCENVGGVFGGFNITTITADADSRYFFTESNVLYSYNGDSATSLTVQYYPAGNRISELALNENVTRIGDRVFANRYTIQKITIPANVTEIGAYAFDSCIGLEEVTFAPRTKNLTIGDYAFSYCTSLQAIAIPASAVKLGRVDDNGKVNSMKVFDNCWELKEITVEAGNTSFASKDGILYGKNAAGEADILYYCPISNTVKNVVVPENVMVIFAEAFADNRTVETIGFEAETLNERFEIERYAFQNMSALKTVNLPEGMEVIGVGIFKGSSIESFVCPNSVNSLGVEAFKNCRNLKSFTFKSDRTAPVSIADSTYNAMNTPSSPTRIDGVFTNSGLEEITLPAGSDVGNHAFAYSGLRKVVLPEGMKKIKAAVFAGCDKLTTVNIPSTVELIENYAFYDCTMLKSIVIPDKCEEIGIQSFSYCRYVEEFDLGRGLKKIGDNSFSQLGYKGTLTIPNSVISIGGDAFTQAKIKKVVFENDAETQRRDSLTLDPGFMGIFFYCDNLEEVVFPDMYGFITIKDSYEFGASIFSSCEKLATVTLGTSINSMAQLFQNCPITAFNNLLTNANFLYENGILYNSSKTQILMAVAGEFNVENLVIPNEITVIHPSAFKGFDCIKSVYIPKSVEEIGEDAFSELINLESVTFAPDCDKDVAFGRNAFSAKYDPASPTYYASKLTAVKFPASVKRLSAYMFRGSALTEVTTEMFPGVIDIGDNCFADCGYLTKVDLSGNTDLRFSNTYGDDWIGDDEVYNGAYAFNDCENLAEVIFPAQLNAIPYSMFDGCIKLEKFDFEKYKVLETIDFGAFRKTAIKKAILPESVRYIGGNGRDAQYAGGAFANCSQLEEVYIGKNIYALGTNWGGGWLFANCTNLKKVTIAGNPEQYAPTHDMFYNCPSLTEVIFTDDCEIEVIFGNMFANLNITSIRLPDSVTEIQAGAFSGCTKLVSINMPENLEVIGDNAFANCPLSDEINLPGTLTKIGNGAFSGCSGVTAFVVDASNSMFTSDEDGIVYDLSNAVMIYPAGSPEPKFTLKASVTAIRDYAFAGAANLKKIYIPENVMTIGTRAFNGWTKEQAIYFEVSAADSVHYGSGWRKGNKAQKFFSYGVEFEEPGCYMSEDFDASEIFKTIRELGKENGMYIEFSVVTDRKYAGGFVEELSAGDAEAYGYGFSGDYVYRYEEEYSTRAYVYDLSGEDMYTYYSFNVLSTGERKDVYMRYNNSYPEGATKEAVYKKNLGEVYTILTYYTQMEDEMKKSEGKLLGRECWVYTLTDGLEVYEFYFDKATGLCLKGNVKTEGDDWGMKYEDTISFVCTKLETSYTVAVPTEDEITKKIDMSE